MSEIGNSNRITRAYLDSLLIETRYMDSVIPTTDFELYGEHFASPIMTAALSHLDHFMFPGAAEALATGAKDANAVLWYGMAPEEEIDRLSATGARMIEIIKPYRDRELIFRKIQHAEGKKLLAVGIDIDHPFGEDGTADIVDGQKMAPLRTDELAEICRATTLPVVIKGILSLQDAERSLAAGAGGWCCPITITGLSMRFLRWPCCLKLLSLSVAGFLFLWIVKSTQGWMLLKPWP